MVGNKVPSARRYEPASKHYRLSGQRCIVPTFAARGCHVVSTASPLAILIGPHEAEFDPIPDIVSQINFGDRNQDLWICSYRGGYFPNFSKRVLSDRKNVSSLCCHIYGSDPASVSSYFSPTLASVRIEKVLDRAHVNKYNSSSIQTIMICTSYSCQCTIVRIKPSRVEGGCVILIDHSYVADNLCMSITDSALKYERRLTLGSMGKLDLYIHLGTAGRVAAAINRMTYENDRGAPTHDQAQKPRVLGQLVRIVGVPQHLTGVVKHQVEERVIPEAVTIAKMKQNMTTEYN
uniref:Uncharacterized protein n=1 Tax=Timema tahoe TaxID=61484 RepID=A0A7R9FJS4_9NEOP|nr:unnamed protein product [Timema tahoe]